MAGRVAADERANGAQQTDESRKANRTPPVVILKVSKHCFRIATRSHNPKNNNEGDEAQKMKHHCASFQKRESPIDVRVEEDTEEGSSDCEQGAMPSFAEVVWISEDNERLDLQGDSICGCNHP